MPKAALTDQDLVVNIISESFRDNPSVLSVIKNDSKKQQRIRVLARYAFRFGFRRNGVWLSSDRQAVAICYQNSLGKENFSDILDQITLAFRAIGIHRVLKIAKRDSYIKKQRPESDFLYFWFFGATDSGKGQGGALALKKELFEEANKFQLPLLLETSVEKNMRVYQRFGFKIYHKWKNTEGQLWFMKRSVQ